MTSLRENINAAEISESTQKCKWLYIFEMTASLTVKGK
jgi:hypothetical protein